MDPESSHDLSFSLLSQLYRIPGFPVLFRAGLAYRVPISPVEVMGLRFTNPVGLAAGLDKNAQYVRPLADIGFGWLELGTVTPRTQSGNRKKRLFRLAKHSALINRMGFNSAGLNAFRKNLRGKPQHTIIGVNLGKNADTPIEYALEDYLTGMRILYTLADYIAINISSPNTKDLRALQEAENLNDLLHGLKSEQQALVHSHGRYVPIALKIAPDLTDNQINEIAERVVRYRIDAVIATNTTVTRPTLAGVPEAAEQGGLSGRPLKDLSTSVIRKLYQRLQGQPPIIGVGGVSSAQDAWEKLVAGADLIQIYSTLIFKGPGIIRKIVSGLNEKTRALGCETLVEAIAKARKTT